MSRGPAASNGSRHPVCWTEEDIFWSAPMEHARAHSALARFCALALVAAIPTALAIGTCTHAVAEEESQAYIVEAGDVTAKVGESAVMQVTLKIRDGYRV